MLALLAVLTIETVLTMSLWADGWLGTGQHLRMMVAGAAAALPLGVAVWLLLRNRFRFGLRSLLAAMALVAVFMFLSVRPLLEARNARQASRLLTSVGIKLDLEPEDDHYRTIYMQIGHYMKIEHDLRPPRSVAKSPREIPTWLRPIAGDLPSLPSDDNVLSVGVESDVQMVALCQMAPRLKNLESIAIWGQVSPAGLGLLKNTLPKFESLVELQLGVPAPVGYFESLTTIRSLFIWREQATHARWLTATHLQEIAGMPRLEVLMFLGYGNINDSNVHVLSRSNSLKRLLFRMASISRDAQIDLSEAMPRCEIRFW